MQEKPKHSMRSKARVNMKVGQKHGKARVSITKKEFEGILTKVFTRPVSGKHLEGDQEANQTSEPHLSDGYNETRKSQDTLEGKGD